MVWPFKRKQKAVKTTIVNTEVLATMRAARTLLHRHIGASFSLSLALIICIFGISGTTYFLATQKVDHVLRVNGILQAIEQSTPVTHNTGGIVSNVFVTDGEIVEEGQILMSLDASDIKSSHGKAQNTVAGLMLQSLCLKAERDGKTKVTVPKELRVALGRLSQIETLHRVVRECQGQLHKAALHRLDAKSAIVALQSKIHLYSRLSHAGQSLRGRLHQLGNQVQEQELQAVLNLQNLVEALKIQIKYGDLKKQLASLQIMQRTETITQRQKLDQKLDRVIDALSLAEQTLAKLDLIRENRYIYASESGRVQRLRIKNSGKRIARGAYILEIAPLSTDFEVVATVNIADLPYIQIGQQVTVSLSSGLPKAVAVPATIVRIVKATENTRNISIAIKREDLNKRDLLVGERSLNGLGERSEALIEVQSQNAFSTLREILSNNYFSANI